MLPKWKQEKYILVLLFWVLSLYDVNEREVWSMALNDNIKKFREEKNLTQQQLADKLYVSRQTVCRWENGSRCPDLITAKYTNCGSCIFGNHDFTTSATRYESTCMVYNHLLYYCSGSISL